MENRPVIECRCARCSKPAEWYVGVHCDLTEEIVMDTIDACSKHAGDMVMHDQRVFEVTRIGDSGWMNR